MQVTNIVLATKTLKMFHIQSKDILKQQQVRFLKSNIKCVRICSNCIVSVADCIFIDDLVIKRSSDTVLKTTTNNNN